jgi:hypothetical protein
MPRNVAFFGAVMDEIGICCYQQCQQSGCGRPPVTSTEHGALLMVLQFQLMRSNPHFGWAMKAAAVAGLLLLGAGARDAQSQPGPFSALHGSWSGGGTIKKSNGSSERIRCRSAFETTGAGNLSLRLRCASDSYNFDLSANVAYQGGEISGSWQESSRNVTGGISGRSAGEGRQVQAIAQAPGVTSNITLTTRGNHQSVLILTPGAEVPEITVSLEKK